MALLLVPLVLILFLYIKSREKSLLRLDIVDMSVGRVCPVYHRELARPAFLKNAHGKWA